MKEDFKELLSYYTEESFNTFINKERNLLLHQPSYLIKENKWEIIPNTSEAFILNNFYKKFPGGIQGSKDECIKLVKNYK